MSTQYSAQSTLVLRPSASHLCYATLGLGGGGRGETPLGVASVEDEMYVPGAGLIWDLRSRAHNIIAHACNTISGTVPPLSHLLGSRVLCEE